MLESSMMSGRNPSAVPGMIKCRSTAGRSTPPQPWNRFCSGAMVAMDRLAFGLAHDVRLDPFDAAGMACGAGMPGRAGMPIEDPRNWQAQLREVSAIPDCPRFRLIKRAAITKQPSRDRQA